MQFYFFTFAAACFALATAQPLLLEDEDGNQYLATPLLTRERRGLDLSLPDEYKNPFPKDAGQKHVPIPQAPSKSPFEFKPPEHGQLTGGGAFNNKQNGGAGVNYQAPSGANVGLGYGHGRGWGHDVSLDVSHPVYTDGKNTISLGAGASKHFGGFLGSMTTDRRFGVSYSRPW